MDWLNESHSDRDVPSKRILTPVFFTMIVFVGNDEYGNQKLRLSSQRKEKIFFLLLHKALALASLD